MADPDDLRARAASIFRQLRQEATDSDLAGRAAEPGATPEDGEGPRVASSPLDSGLSVVQDGFNLASPSSANSGEGPASDTSNPVVSSDSYDEAGVSAPDDGGLECRAALSIPGAHTGQPDSSGTEKVTLEDGTDQSDPSIVSLPPSSPRDTNVAIVPQAAGPNAESRAPKPPPPRTLPPVKDGADADQLPTDTPVAIGTSLPQPNARGAEPDSASRERATWAATRLKLADLELPALYEEDQSDADAETDDRSDSPEVTRRHPGSRRSFPRVMAIANQKGGVGKTTTAVNLGAGLAELGYRVLVVDLDPQGNASTGLGVNARNLEASVYDVILHDVAMEDVIEPTTLRNLFVVPATIDLAGAEIELVPAFSRELRLRRAVDSISDDFDFVIIDCPPSLGLLTVNGLAAATEVVVPIQCEYYALEGLGQLLRNVNLVQANLNPKLEVSTIVLTMYDARTRLAEQVVDEVRRHFGTRVCRNVVPRTVRLSEAPSYGQPIIVFDPSSRGAIAYRELAKEVSGGAPQRVR